MTYELFCRLHDRPVTALTFIQDENRAKWFKGLPDGRFCSSFSTKESTDWAILVLTKLGATDIACEEIKNTVH